MATFFLHDGFLCTHGSDSGVRKKKVDMRGIDATRQQQIIQTLNSRKDELKIVKYAASLWKIYFIANHAYLERLGDGSVTMHDLPPAAPFVLQWNHIC